MKDNLLFDSKPDEEEYQYLISKYGEPKIRNIDRYDVKEITLPVSHYENCIGEGVGIILDNSGKYVLVKKKNEVVWFFPSGRVMKGETIEEGTIREVFEETGLKVELESLPSIHIKDLHFKNGILRLWHFNFIIKTYNGTLQKEDDHEIGDCGFFSEPPETNRQFEKEWIQMVLEDIKSQ